MRITLELLTEERFPDAETIDRADIPEAFVDTVDTSWLCIVTAWSMHASATPSL